MSSRLPGASTEAYRADTNRLAVFVERGRRYRADLSALSERVQADRRRAVGALDGGPPAVAAPAFAQLLDAVDATTGAANAVRLALLDVVLDGVRPVLRRAVIDGQLPAPDDDLRSRVLAAILDGLGPAEAGIDPAYFPASVLRHRTLRDRIAALEAERDRVDGRPYVWWDGDVEATAGLDRRLDHLLARLDSLAEHGIEPDGAVDRLAAAALVAEATGGSAWEGAVYAGAFAQHRADSRTTWVRLGPDGGILTDLSGFVFELDHLSERVAADPDVALGFFGGLGPAATADLPSFVVGAGGSIDRVGEELVLHRLSLGLAAASRAVDAANRPRLGFSGGDLIDPSRSDSLPADRFPAGVRVTPARLFGSGVFDDRFLADAVVAALHLGNGGQRGRSDRADHPAGQAGPGPVVGAVASAVGGAVGGAGSVDPRNLLLDRAAERPQTVRLVMERLAGVGPRPIVRWPGAPVEGPASAAFDALLRPAVPIPSPPGRDAGAGRNQRTLGSFDQPPLDDPSPVTAFLGRVAADAEASRWLLHAVADGVSTDAAAAPVIQDPATAAGLDLILGANASVMFDTDDLAAVGIEPAALNDDTARPVGREAWRAVVGEVRRWGRGQALATATAGLLTEAIAGSIGADGRLEVDRTIPFAHLAGRAEAEAHHALLAHAATLDDEARRWNRQVNLSVTVGLVALGLVPGVGAVATPVGLGWAFLYEGRPTDAELSAYQQLWDDHYDSAKSPLWRRVVAEVWLAAEVGPDESAAVELLVPGLGLRSVEVQRAAEPGHYRWRHPETGGWQPFTIYQEAKMLDLFPNEPRPALRRAVGGAAEIDEDFRDGILARRLAGRRPETLVDDDREAVEEADWTDDWLGGRP